MPRKTAVQAVPPPAPKKEGKAINVYLKPVEIQQIDAIAGAMGGTRSDAIRWFLSLAREAMDGQKKSSHLS